mgnify:CR=1
QRVVVGSFPVDDDFVDKRRRVWGRRNQRNLSTTEENDSSFCVAFHACSVYIFLVGLLAVVFRFRSEKRV